MADIRIHSLTKDDWRLYKSLRLSSLKNSPDSFGSTFKRESAFSDEEWFARLDFQARQMQGLLFIALLKEQPVGLACGIVHTPGEQDGHIYQMWVSPAARGLGIGGFVNKSYN